MHITDIQAWCKIAFGNNESNPMRLGADLYLNNEKVTNLTIPDTITDIKSYTFNSCKSLTSVTIPDSVTSIGSYAFCQCDNITSVTIGAGVIGSSVFSQCHNLASITIGTGVNTIGSSAFYQCYNLTSITIPDSVTSIGSSAFQYCYKLVQIINNSDLTIKPGDTNNGYIAQYAVEVVTPEEPTQIKTDSNGFMIFNDTILVGYTGEQTEIVIPDRKSVV